jgi:uncharacterized protein (TIGR02265 family)
MPPPPESLTRGTAFEGLFVRALQPTGAFAEALRAAGYEVGSPPRAEYPTRVWQACVDLARRHTFPQLPRPEGERRLGERFMDGFFQTLSGKLLGATLPVLGPDTVMQRLPRLWASSQPNMGVATTRVAERHWTVTLRERGVMADFCVGVISAVLKRTRVEPELVVAEHDAEHCVLTVRWRGA